MTNSNSWSVYLLWNPVTRRTYVGSTTDPFRRLRQHNKEIQGGARSTAPGAPHWVLRLHVEGFENRSVACRWEKLVKVRARGLLAREQALMWLVDGVCPAGRKPYPVPEGLTGVIGPATIPPVPYNLLAYR